MPILLMGTPPVMRLGAARMGAPKERKGADYMGNLVGGTSTVTQRC
jgi:hypothetical protein